MVYGGQGQYLFAVLNWRRDHVSAHLCASPKAFTSTTRWRCAGRMAGWRSSTAPSRASFLSTWCMSPSRTPVSPWFRGRVAQGEAASFQMGSESERADGVERRGGDGRRMAGQLADAGPEPG